MDSGFLISLNAVPVLHQARYSSLLPTPPAGLEEGKMGSKGMLWRVLLEAWKLG